MTLLQDFTCGPALVDRAWDAHRVIPHRPAGRVSHDAAFRRFGFRTDLAVLAWKA